MWARTHILTTRARAHTHTHTHQVLIRLGPGEIFGEISFLDAGDVGAAASVRAETEVTVSGGGGKGLGRVCQEVEQRACSRRQPHLQ